MAIINLENRITNEMVVFDNNKKSAKSLVFSNISPSFEQGNKETLILHVGDHYIKDSQNIAIPESGYIVKPGKSILFETEEKIAIPLNVIGIIYGIGTNIFKGGFISAGKIDQGFSNNLKICFYNAGNQNFTFKKGDALACAIFIETEDTAQSTPTERRYDQLPVYDFKFKDRIKLFMSNNIVSIISILIAAGTLLFEILSK